MCGQCKETVNAGGCMKAVGTRNAIVPGTDRDTGPNTRGISAPEISEQQVRDALLLRSIRYQQLADDKLFDYTHPVDEYQPNGNNTGATPLLTIQPDYDMPERITSIVVIVPVGTTAANIQLGQRTLPIYAGAALTTPTLFTIPECGFILNSDDPRIATFTGATAAGYFGLMGWALTRGQFS